MQARQEMNILVIGAGPVGLRFVIELINKMNSSHQHNITINIIERNKTYTRTQDLTLNFSLIENDPRLKNALQELIDQERATRDSQGNIHIAIQELEKCLAAYAKDLGITIENRRFMTQNQYEKLLLENKEQDREALETKLGVGIILGREEITKFYPHCKIIVGADGARSSVRQLISGQEEETSIEKKDLRYLIEVKYFAEGKVKKLSKLNYYRSQALLRGFLCAESVKYLKDSNKSQVTIRFLVDEETYNDPRLNHINAKNVLPICADLPLPSLLRKVINTWLSLRGDNIELTSGTINKTILSIYSSKMFGTADNRQAILLLGDAASGFPYMNGWNLGNKQAIASAQMVTEHANPILEDKPDSMQHFVTEYSIMAKAIFDEGFKIVATRDHEITQNKRIAQSVFVTSSVVKVAERAIRESDHPIFSKTVHPYCLDLQSLNQYVEKSWSFAHKDTFLLGMEVLTLLMKHQRSVVKDPNQVDFPFLQAVLTVAYHKNQAIVARAKNWGLLSSLSQYAEEPAQRKKSRYAITEQEIKTAVESPMTTMPLQSPANTGSLQDSLHDIIYQLFTETISLERKHRLNTRKHDIHSNRHILMAKENQKLETPEPASTKQSSFRCVVS